MKRETLKELGLTGEQIDAVMSDYGSSVNDLKKQLTALEGERDQFKSQLETSSQELETKLAEQHKELAINFALTSSNAKDNDLVKSLIDREKISIMNGELQGLNEQIESIKIEKDFLFQQVPDKQERSTPTIMVGGNPSGGHNVNRTAFDDIKNKYH